MCNVFRIVPGFIKSSMIIAIVSVRDQLVHSKEFN